MHIKYIYHYNKYILVIQHYQITDIIINGYKWKILLLRFKFTSLF